MVPKVDNHWIPRTNTQPPRASDNSYSIISNSSYLLPNTLLPPVLSNAERAYCPSHLWPGTCTEGAKIDAQSECLRQAMLKWLWYS
ncbi:hypothetical protein Tco_1305596 [Tanacetum coccineum]